MNTRIRKILAALTLAVGFTTAATAANPIAVWDGFSSLTSGSYTWTKSTGTTITDGVVTIGSDGGLTMASPTGLIDGDKASVTFIADIEGYDPTSAQKTIFDIGLSSNNRVNISNLSTTDKNVYQLWNAKNGYGNVGTISTGKVRIITTYKGGSGTTTYVVGGNTANSTGLHSSNDSITSIGIGCYSTERVATGMKVHRLAMFNSKLSEADAKAYKFPSEILAYTATLSSDKALSELEWTPAKPAGGFTDGSELTINNTSAAKLTLDTALTVKDIKIVNAAGAAITLVPDASVTAAWDFSEAAGGVTIDASGLSGTDLAKNAVVGAPYSYWTGIKGSITGTPTVTVPAEMPTDYTVTSEVVSGFGVRLIVAAPSFAKLGAVNLNLHNGTALSGDGNHGLYPVALAGWGNLQVANNGSTTQDGLTFTLSSSVSGYGVNNAPPDLIQKQYMDDNNNGVTRTLTVSGMAAKGYAKYRAIVYFSTDSADISFAPLSVTAGGVTTYYAGPTEGSTTAGYTLKGSDSTWGHTGANHNANALGEGVNALVTDVMTADSITLNFLKKNGKRATPCAVQVVKVGEVVYEPKNYTAEISSAVNLSEIVWTPAKTRPFGLSDTLTVTVSGNATLTFDEDASVEKLTVVSAVGADLSLTKGGDVTLTPLVYDFSGASGKTTVSYDPGSASVKAGADTVLGTANANNTLTIGEDKKLTVKSGSLTASKVSNSGTLNFDGGTAENPITLNGDANFGVVTLAANTYVKNTVDNNRNHIVTGTDLTSCYAVSKASGEPGMGQNNALANLTFITDTASKSRMWIERVTITDESNVGFKPTTTMYLNVSPVVKALNGAGEITRAGSNVLTVNCSEAANYSGASAVPFTIGGTAVQTLSGNYTGALTVNEGGSVHLTGSAIPSSMTVNGTVTIDPNGGTKTISGTLSGAGAIIVRDSSEEGNGSVVFSGTRTDFTGTITFEHCAMDIGSARTIPAEYTIGSDVKLSLQQTSEEFLAGATTMSGIPATIKTVVIVRADRETVEVPVVDGAISYTFTDNKLSGPATIMDFTFKKATLAQRQTESSDYILNDGSWGKNNGLKYDAGYSAANSYNTQNGALLAKSTPWRDMTDEQAWPANYTVAVYANVPDVEKGCLVAFGSTTGGDKNYLAITRGATSDEILLMKGHEKNSAAETMATMAAENATASKHLVVFTKSGDNFCVYCDGTKVTDFTLESFSLGTGFQIGSVHGGIAGTGIVRISEIAEQSKKDAVEFGMIRVFDKVITDAEMAELAEQFSYVSLGGLYERTIGAAAENLQADGAWADRATAETTDLPQLVEEGGKTYRPSVSVTVAVESTLTVNESALFDKVTFEAGTAALTIVADEGKSVDVSGAIKVKSPVAFKYGVLDISKAPISISGDGAIELDLSTYGALADVRTTTRYQLTGLCDEAGFSVKEGTLPSNAYLTSSVVYADNHWWLEVKPNREAGTVYLPSGTTTLTDDTIVKLANGDDALLLAGDTLVIRTSETLALNQTLTLAGITIDDAAVVEVKNGADGYALNGETITVNNGTLRLTNGSGTDAVVNGGTVNISENGQLGVTGWITVNGTFAINSGYEKTVLANTGANAIRIRGTGKIVKGGEGAMTFACYLDNGTDGVHPVEVANGTLVLTQDALVGAVTGSGTITIPEGKTLTAASLANTVKIEGAGTLVSDGKVPGTSLNFGEAAKWTGTVWIKNFTENGTVFNGYANANARVRFTGVKGWMNYQTPGTTCTLDLVDGENNVTAFEVTDGSLNKNYSFAKITGNGTFGVSSVHTDAFIVQVKDVSAFTGRLLSVASTTPGNEATTGFPIYVGVAASPEVGTNSRITVESGVTICAPTAPWQAEQVAFGATLSVKSNLAVDEEVTLVNGLTAAPTGVRTDGILSTTKVTQLDPTTGEPLTGRFKVRLKYEDGAVKLIKTRNNSLVFLVR